MRGSAHIHPLELNSVVEDEDKDENSAVTKKSLGIFDIQSPLRKFLIEHVVKGHFFHNFILMMICLNAITMACVDYKVVNDDYSPSSESSPRNASIEILELMFLIIFILECVFKVIAQGFIEGEGAYFCDNWNRFDFLIVLLSIISMIPRLPNLTMLRSVRVLRPLRSINRLPGLKKIIRSLLKSVEDLSQVMILLLLALIFFSIFGVLFWKGLLHARCRLTPFPIKMPINCRDVKNQCWHEFIQQAVLHANDYRCIDEPNDNDLWTQTSSPWYVEGPQDCIWPIDNNDTRVCSLSGNGYHVCSPRYTEKGEKFERTCGSNYDNFGNRRFINTIEPYGYPRMFSGNYIEELNWGYTSFDSFFQSFLTTFQIITAEGWTDIMYQVIDAWSFAPAVVFFSVEIILGGYIILNLVLAVITKSLDDIEEETMNDQNNLETTENESMIQSKLGIKKVKSTPIMSLVGGKFHSTFIMSCIIANTVVLGMDHYGISEKQATVLEYLNGIFTIIFLIDVIICNIAYGIKIYWSDPHSIFDGLIAFISITELIILQVLPNVSDGSSSFSIFRSLRLFRVFKMARRWKSLHSIIRTMTDSVAEIGNFAILLLLFMFIYALVGMQIFSNRFHFDEETGAVVHLKQMGYNESIIPRSHFDNFFWSMTTVFQLLTGENWNAIMYDGLKSRLWVAALYFLSLVVIGVFIVMNLFLAILLKNFDGNEDFVDVPHVENSLSFPSNNPSVEDEKKMHKSDPVRPSTIQILGKKFGKAHPFRKWCFSVVDTTEFDSFVTVLIVLSSICLAADNPLVDPQALRITWIRNFDLFFTIIFIVEMVVKVFAYGFFFEREAYLRNGWNLVDFAVVIISILNLAKIGPGKALRVLRTLRVLRPLRMINRLPELKVVVDALIMSFPSVANVAVLCLLFFLIFASFGVNFLKGTFFECKGDAFSSLSKEKVSYLTNPYEWGKLTSSQRSWFNASASYCLASEWSSETIPSSKQVCNCLAPGEWVETIPQNFNNIFSGMALLFEISTTEGWTDVMFAAIDQRGIDSQPVRDSNILWAFFFIFFLIVGGFFVLELFVGVTIDNFNKIRENTGRGLMTDAQREWAATQAFILRIKPEKRLKRPHGRFRSWCYDFIMPTTNPSFQKTITGLILLNCACTAAVNFGDPPLKTFVLEYCNLLFAVIFTFEVALGIIALRSRYFNDQWNRFDFIVVCGSNIGLLSNAFFPQLRSFTALIRLFRVFRLIRLFKFFKKLRTLFNTMIVSIPSIINIGSLLFLLFFIYAVCGMQLYSFIPENEFLNQHASFRSFGKSMMLLLRFSTGENWNGFMRSMISSKEGCDIDPIYNSTLPWCLHNKDYPLCSELNGCGGGYTVFIYFYSFTLFVSFVIMNLFVGVVLEAFENSREGEILGQGDLDHFSSIWTEFDPDATWYIDVTNIKSLVTKLHPPLGVADVTGEQIGKVMNDPCLLELPVNSEGKVNIVQIASGLAKRVAKQKQGNNFHELDDDHPIQKRMVHSKNSSGTTIGDIQVVKQKKKLQALRAFVKAQKSNNCKFIRDV